MSERDEREKLREVLKRILVDMIQRNSNRLIIVDYETTIDYILAAFSPIPADGEAHAEIQRLRDAKRRALALADERAKENVELRAALLRVSEATPDNDAHYFGAIKIRLETLYKLTSVPNIREHISDEIDWVNEKLGDPVEPADTPDEGPDPLGYAKGER